MISKTVLPTLTDLSTKIKMTSTFADSKNKYVFRYHFNTINANSVTLS